MTSSAVNEAVGGGMCIGCGACAIAAPQSVEVRLGRDGFLGAAEVSAVSASQDQLIRAVCPALAVSTEQRPSDPIWGTVLAIRKAHATDPILRHKAASGGALSALAAHLLRSRQVAKVLTVAPSATDPFRVVPVAIDSPASLLSSVGSRYTPAPAVLAFAHTQGRAETVAFIGKPCDVSAARALEKAGALGPTRVGLYISFLCAGTPSTDGTTEILRRMGVDRADVTAFSYRGNGWPGSATAETSTGLHEMTYAESWGECLGPRIHSRCKYCGDAIGLAADVVFGDAWESDEHGYPLFDERPGQSIVIVRTEGGRRAIQDAEAAEELMSAASSLAELSAVQPYQVHRRRYMRARLLGRRVAGRPTPQYGGGVGLRRAAGAAGMQRQLREFVGAFRRSRREER